MQNAFVHIERAQDGDTDRLRSYNVILDGIKAASVKRGQSLTLETGAGHHTLHIAIDWCRSPSVDIDLLPGQRVHIRCWPNARPTPKIFYWITFGRSRYIGIEIVNVTSIDS